GGARASGQLSVIACAATWAAPRLSFEEMTVSAPEFEQHLTFALFSVETSSPVTVRRQPPRPGNNSQSWQAPQADQHSASGGAQPRSVQVRSRECAGLTRLLCGDHYLFESFPSVRRLRDARDVPVFLIPLHGSRTYPKAQSSALDTALSMLSHAY